MVVLGNDHRAPRASLEGESSQAEPTLAPEMLLASLTQPTAPGSHPVPWLAAHCFKSHAGDFLQGVFEYLQPLLLSQGVLLGADHIDVMGDVIRRVIPCLSLPLGEKPGRDLLGRGGVTFNSKTQHQVSQRYIRRIQNTGRGKACGAGGPPRHRKSFGPPHEMPEMGELGTIIPRMSGRVRTQLSFSLKRT